MFGEVACVVSDTMAEVKFEARLMCIAMMASVYLASYYNMLDTCVKYIWNKAIYGYGKTYVWFV